MGETTDTTRRRLLARGALGLGALGALIGGGAAALARSAPAPANLRLRGTGWHAVTAGRPGQLPAPGDAVSVHGALDGDAQGHFYASSIFVGAPLGGGANAASYLETHHFNLDAGTLVGTGTWHVDGTSRFTVIGGTGRYAGASGSYEAVQRPYETGGDGTAEFRFELNLPGGGDGRG